MEQITPAILPPPTATVELSNRNSGASPLMMPFLSDGTPLYGDNGTPLGHGDNSPMFRPSAKSVINSPKLQNFSYISGSTQSKNQTIDTKNPFSPIAQVE
jgi:hypothetical protein